MNCFGLYSLNEYKPAFLRRQEKPARSARSRIDHQLYRPRNHIKPRSRIGPAASPSLQQAFQPIQSCLNLTDPKIRRKNCNIKKKWFLKGPPSRALLLYKPVQFRLQSKPLGFDQFVG